MRSEAGRQRLYDLPPASQSYLITQDHGLFTGREVRGGAFNALCTLPESGCGVDASFSGFGTDDHQQR